MKFLAFALLAVCGLASTGLAAVEDRAAFFSSAARTKANQRIADLEKTYGKTLAVETFTAIPDDVQKAASAEGPANRVYVDWATKQARAKGVNGIYVLLVKNPAHLQAIVGKETSQRAFTMKDRDALVSLMLGKLRQKQNDAALLDGVEFVASTLRAHAPARTGPAVGGYGAQRHAPERERSGGLGWLLPLILVGVGVWVVLGIFRAIFNRSGGGFGGNQYGGGYSSPMYPNSGGGGGFMRGLLGGMLGGAAGAWMYNSFFGGSHSAYGDDRPLRGPEDSGPAFTDRDSDYTSSGGDYGGGGDFGGGGDSGGGGDFGGGGDSGGGGGDF